jgi:hypothetical protein
MTNRALTHGSEPGEESLFADRSTPLKSLRIKFQRAAILLVTVLTVFSGTRSASDFNLKGDSTSEPTNPVR